MSRIFLKIAARDFEELSEMISWGWYYIIQWYAVYREQPSLLPKIRLLY